MGSRSEAGQGFSCRYRAGGWGYGGGEGDVGGEAEEFYGVWQERGGHGRCALSIEGWGEWHAGAAWRGREGKGK